MIKYKNLFVPDIYANNCHEVSSILCAEIPLEQCVNCIFNSRHKRVFREWSRSKGRIAEFNGWHTVRNRKDLPHKSGYYVVLFADNGYEGAYKEEPVEILKYSAKNKAFSTRSVRVSIKTIKAWFFIPKYKDDVNVEEV